MASLLEVKDCKMLLIDGFGTWLVSPTGWFCPYQIGRRISPIA